MPADPTTNPVLNRASKPHTILSAVAAVGLATGAAFPARADTITEQEAHAIGVDAYVYFYPLVTMDITRRQLTNASRRQGLRPRPDEHDFATCRRIRRPMIEGRRAAQLRHALFRRLARSHQGADDRLGARYARALLPAPHARHVVGRIRLAGLAHDRNAGRQLPRRAAGLATRSRSRFAENSSCPPARSASMRRRLTCGSSAAPRPTVPPTTTPCTRSRPATRSRRCRGGASRRSRSHPHLDPGDRHEDAAQDAGRHDAGGASISPTRPNSSSCTRRTSPTSRSSRGCSGSASSPGKSFDIASVDRGRARRARNRACGRHRS